MPEISRDRRIFVPYGTDKGEYLKSIGFNPNGSDILLDDFTPNLRTWHGVGVKLLNGINGTHGTWTGYVVNGKGSADVVAKSLLGILQVA